MGDPAPAEVVERLWRGEASLADWTAAVRGGHIDILTEDIATFSTGFPWGNVTAIRCGDVLVLVDSGSRETAHLTYQAMRQWDDSPISTVLFSHGHIDHTWGVRLLDQQAEALGVRRPHVIAHRSVLERFDRYDQSQQLNSLIIGRQFSQDGYVFPSEHRRPDQVYDDRLELFINDRRVHLAHGRGETDDATYFWLPVERILITGDFLIWAFPNAGNPRKVQRYAVDWAAALRRMAALHPDIVVPGHGPVIIGRERAARVLDDTATVLEDLVTQTLSLMNQGHSLNEVLHQVSASAELLAKPYLLPHYDDPEFVVRGIWHFYAGWYDGNPAHLKSVADAELGYELAGLVGGVDALEQRAKQLVSAGRARLAAQLIEFAVAAEPGNIVVHRTRSEVLAACIELESSLIGKALFADSKRQSDERSAL